MGPRVQEKQAAPRRQTPGARSHTLRRLADPASATLGLAGTLVVLGAVGAAVLPRAGTTLLPGPTGASAAAAVVALAATLLLSQLGQGVVDVHQRSYEFSLTGVPLLVGLLYLPPLWVVAARLAAGLVTVRVQRTAPPRTAYTLAAGLLDSVLLATTAHALLGPSPVLTWDRAVLLYLCLAVVDVLMTALLLLVVRIEVGPLRWRDLTVAFVPAALVVTAISAVGMLCVVLLQAGPVGWVLLGLVATAAGLAHRAHLGLLRRHGNLQLVQSFIDASLHADHGDVRAAELVTRLREVVRAETARLVWRSRDGETQVHVSTHDPGLVLPPVTRPPAGTEGLVPATTPDPALRAWLDVLGAREALVVDLARFGGNGLVVLTDQLGGGSGCFGPDDVHLAGALTGHLVVRLRNSELVDRLRWEATHDTLTRLPNRTVLLSALELYLGPTGPATRPGDPHAVVAPQAAVLVLLVDRFGEVNDALGHAVGDEVLEEVAGRLTRLQLPGATVARMSGEHFAVAVPAVGPGGAVELAELLRSTTAQPVTLADAVISVGARVGVATCGDGTTRPDAPELLRRADVALAAARTDGRQVAVYERSMDSGRTERLALLGDLHRALAEDRLTVVFQPKLDLVAGRVSGVEALARWNHPVLGPVAPSVFVPLAESAGLIDRLTDLVLDSALEHARRWEAAGHDLVVAVNLSPRSLDDATLPDRVGAALARAGVRPDRLVLEITETSIMGDPARTLPVLDALAGLGVGLSLDDFGTGYSSLAYLQRLPVQELKVDRSFVVALEEPTAERSVALMRAILALAEGLGLRVVAEGVESARAMTVLRELGCDHVQGFLVSRPVAASAVPDVVRAVADDPSWSTPLPRQRDLSTAALRPHRTPAPRGPDRRSITSTAAG